MVNGRLSGPGHGLGINLPLTKKIMADADFSPESPISR
jgi:hypothetical protein